MTVPAIRAAGAAGRPRRESPSLRQKPLQVNDLQGLNFWPQILPTPVPTSWRRVGWGEATPRMMRDFARIRRGGAGDPVDGDVARQLGGGLLHA